MREIMVPRTNIAAIEVTSSRSDLVNLLVEGGYSRIPVYEESLDNIIGVVHAKDLITLMEHRDLIILRDLLRPAFFVPETKPIDDLLREFQRRKVHIAMVVDEFGSTAGLVTMEDILEELVGEIQDEHDGESHDIEKVSHQTYIVKRGPFYFRCQRSHHEFELPRGMTTPAWVALSINGSDVIPEVNEMFEYDALRMTVLKTDNHHVTQVKIEKLSDLRPRRPPP